MDVQLDSTHRSLAWLSAGPRGPSSAMSERQRIREELRVAQGLPVDMREPCMDFRRGVPRPGF